MEAIDILNTTLRECHTCPGNKNKTLICGSGDVLYIVPSNDDIEILSHRGVVIKEVACDNGIDYICNIYVRSLMTQFNKIVATTEYVSKLLGRSVEEFEVVRWRGKTFVATNNPCDIRVRQELGVK